MFTFPELPNFLFQVASPTRAMYRQKRTSIFLVYYEGKMVLLSDRAEAFKLFHAEDPNSLKLNSSVLREEDWELASELLPLLNQSFSVEHEPDFWAGIPDPDDPYYMSGEEIADMEEANEEVRKYH